MHYRNAGNKNLGSAQDSNKFGLSSHRSDHEIHTPEHRSFTEDHKQVVGFVI